LLAPCRLCVVVAVVVVAGELTQKLLADRCTRNCFSCPVCFAALSVTATGEDQTGPFILLCSHCLWSSQDIGIEFEKPTSITAQLAQKLKAANASSTSAASLATPSDSLSASRPLSPLGASYLRPPSPSALPEQNDEAEFGRLKAHYNQQKALASGDDYGGSGSLSRLMGLYTSNAGRIRPYGAGATVTARNKAEWRELEHLRLADDDEEEVIENMKRAGFHGTASQAQRIVQTHSPRLLDELRPLAALLRTKRSKRCRSCRHILVKPESKVGSIRHRIRLIAGYAFPWLALNMDGD
jgi:dynactin-4